MDCDGGIFQGCDGDPQSEEASPSDIFGKECELLPSTVDADVCGEDGAGIFDMDDSPRLMEGLGFPIQKTTTTSFHLTQALLKLTRASVWPTPRRRITPCARFR